MDPRFNCLLTEKSKEVAIEHITVVWARLLKLKGTDGERALETVESVEMNPDSAEQVEESEEPVDIIEQLLRTKDKENNRPPSNENAALENLLKSVKAFKSLPRLGRKENLLEFWERQKYAMPELYQVACAVLSVPCTQVYTIF